MSAHFWHNFQYKIFSREQTVSGFQTMKLIILVLLPAEEERMPLVQAPGTSGA